MRDYSSNIKQAEAALETAKKSKVEFKSTDEMIAEIKKSKTNITPEIVKRGDAKDVNAAVNNMKTEFRNLISEVNGATRQYATQFNSVQQKSWIERMAGKVGFQDWADARVDARIQSMDLSDLKQDLLAKNDEVLTIMRDSLDLINEERDGAFVAIRDLEVKYEATNTELEAREKEVEKLERDVRKAERDIETAKDKAAQAAAESVKRQAVEKLNDLKAEIKKLTIEGQNYQNFITQFDADIQTSTEQKNALDAMIRAFEIGADARTKLFDDLDAHIKTSNVLDVSSETLEVNEEVDKMGMQLNAQALSSAQNTFATMAERGKPNLEFNMKLLDEVDAATKDFENRMDTVKEDYKGSRTTG